MNDRTNLDRRRWLARVGGLGAFGLGASLFAALPRRVRAAAGLQNCTLMPSQTEGPFYIDPALLRRDITDGLAGLPLILNLRVVQSPSCTPVKDAIVDIWHADSAGIYSGFTGQLNGIDSSGQNFLRGIQVTDANGNATFCTVYPGWYPGRTAHIHVKVLLANRTAVTSQLYFDDAVSDEVYASIEPYAVRGNSGRTRNANDGIYSALTQMSLTPVPGGIAASFRMVVA
jgi:protocatechuate 3,4-dioxygenase beta subunit